MNQELLASSRTLSKFLQYILYVRQINKTSVKLKLLQRTTWVTPVNLGATYILGKIIQYNYLKGKAELNVIMRFQCCHFQHSRLADGQSQDSINRQRCRKAQHLS